MTIDKKQRPETGGDQYFPISPFMIFPEAYGDFSIYLKKGRHFLLYTRRGEQFTERHKATLYENGIEEVYIRTSQKTDYQEYLEKNLGEVLMKETIPIAVRSNVFYHATSTTIQEVVGSKLPTPVNEQLHRKLLNIVAASVRFICTKKALKTVASLMSHDYQTYTHSANVFIYTISILETYNLSDEEKLHCGLGALLHDIGKSSIPQSILNKPGKLNAREWEIIKTHPLKGVGQCSLLPLNQATINCILFHHEKCDGSGYPAGLKESNIPMASRVVSVADVYDAITSNRPYAEAVTPFRALSIMREDMKEALDPDVFRRLVLVLSGAEIV
jgi:HD-GYP domain-containing protein (c-di-GMP phosphodiesterase class II)